MHSLIMDHPFVDGDKRTALPAAGLFLELNGYRLVASNHAALEFTQSAAVGRVELGEMARWLEVNSRPAADCRFPRPWIGKTAILIPRMAAGCGPGGTRTLDLLNAIETRSQLRYRPIGVALLVHPLVELRGFEPLTSTVRL